ncbi:MAG: carbon-nitrogen hydrolase family protein [Acidobacteriota bacterium]
MDGLNLIAEQVRVCESAGVKILCCPDVLGGLADYSNRPSDIALDFASGQLQSVLAPIASTTVTTIVGFSESGRNGLLFNSAAVFSKGKVVGVYRKLHPAINRSVHEPGTATPVFDVNGLIFGIVICRDSTYPIPAQIMARRGATVLFVPTNNALAPAKAGADVVEQVRHTDISRARENGVWVVRSDVAGQANGLVSYGSSGIIDRDGVLRRSARLWSPIYSSQTFRSLRIARARIGLTSQGFLSRASRDKILGWTESGAPRLLLEFQRAWTCGEAPRCEVDGGLDVRAMMGGAPRVNATLGRHAPDPRAR